MKKSPHTSVEEANTRALTEKDAEIARLRAALQPLRHIADAYDENELDEARPDWVERGVCVASHPNEIELFSGRGGTRLLTLADAFAARAALVVPGSKPTTQEGHNG